jgi:hypothetical protein
MRASHLWGLVGGALAIGAAPATAHALTCSVNLTNAAPVGGQANVPTDTLLWGYSSENTRLLGPSGDVVPTEERALVVAGALSSRDIVHVLVPGSALQPNARYTIESSSEGEDPVLNEFVTGAGPASAPQGLPAVVSSDAHVGSFWASRAPARWQNLQFEDIRSLGFILIGDADDPESDPLGAVPSVKDLLIDAPASEEAVADAPLLEWLSEQTELTVGITDCAVWPDGAPDSLTARFAAVDLAGNFSGWAEVPLELPSQAEAQAVVDDQIARDVAAAAEAQRVREDNLAKLAAANRASGCAMPGAPARHASALATLALALLARARRARRQPPPRDE